MKLNFISFEEKQLTFSMESGILYKSAEVKQSRQKKINWGVAKR